MTSSDIADNAIQQADLENKGVAVEILSTGGLELKIAPGSILLHLLA